MRASTIWTWNGASGWTIAAGRSAAAELDGYYRGAHGMMQLGSYVYDERLWSETSAPRPPFDENLLTTRFWQFDEREEPFALRRCDDLVGSANVNIVLHANAVHIQAEAKPHAGWRISGSARWTAGKARSAPGITSLPAAASKTPGFCSAHGMSR